MPDFGVKSQEDFFSFCVQQFFLSVFFFFVNFSILFAFVYFSIFACVDFLFRFSFVDFFNFIFRLLIFQKNKRRTATYVSLNVNCIIQP